MKTDIYQQVTDAIIANIEAGQLDKGINWAKETATGMPINYKTKASYNGINVLLLWNAAREAGFSNNQWLTFKQAAELGGSVKKGEKGQLCVFFKMLDIKDKISDEKKAVPMASPFWLFNLDQIEGIETGIEVALRSDFQQIESAEHILKASQAIIREEGQRAFYHTATDEIYLPERTRFSDVKEFYSVALHELTHWTGAKTRLDRDFAGRFGSEAYAFEELIAELGSAFLNAELGFTATMIPNHAQYINNWLTVLKNDKRAIFTAASQAGKAHSFIMNLVAVAEAKQKAA
ncbi:ArdC family protein [Sulfurirhabdus autotrophica]|uniref:Antirestriction protein ArdC n=1 Tax=Sulfurirhabdus autotrophica TaxID=1706046 RepID=A0A4V2W138_9PROT|nr:zincin-like metallopeptidase domain-containing protein [Sulfurirhabdus autotrophica]TCV82709.1 antirestriction protein ArdC [Sulfurirhabdus autotrophica]